MDQRREPRFVADQPVIVTVLGEQERQLSARICNASGRGLAIEVPSPVPPGSALKLEVDDAMVLGEAVYCRYHDGTSYLIGVQMDQMLCGLLELHKRLRDFIPEDASGAEMAHSVNHRPREHHQQAQEQ
ncbi:MAG TPA: PilZ domain-containing protein [Bryobacteraceae bacterium]|nr:PilZ domain-containing protein [Bryobacteraceae bacterium]